MKIFLKNYNEEGDEVYFLEVNVQCIEKLYELHNVLPFLSERMKTENVKKLEANLHDKTEYVIHIKNLKQTLNYGLFLKKVRKVMDYFWEKFVEWLNLIKMFG